MLGTIALVITVAIVAKVILTVDDWQRDWSHNNAELRRDASKESLRPFDLAATPDAVAGQITDWASMQARWDVIDRTDVNGYVQLHLTRTTPWMRFVDDIHVELSPLPLPSPGNGDSPDDLAANTTRRTRVHARSQSRVGKGDLGQNPRNLIELTDFLRANGLLAVAQK